MIKRTATGLLSGPSASSIRTDTRALIRAANVAESLESAALQSSKDVAITNEQCQALTCAEKQLARSVSLAVPATVGIQVIVSDIIGPVVLEAVVVSKMARESITRAVGMADRS